MLTEDSRETAFAIAQQSKITEFQAEMLPADKVRAVDDLVARHGQVAIAPDGHAGADVSSARPSPQPAFCLHFATCLRPAELCTCTAQVDAWSSSLC
jgi:magnesium-transporting ATPase (P-type)